MAAATEKKEEEPSDHDTLPQTKKEEHDTQPPQTNEEQHEHDTLSQTKKDGGEGKPAIGGKEEDKAIAYPPCSDIIREL